MGILASKKSKSPPKKEKKFTIPHQSLEELEQISITSRALTDIVENAKRQGDMSNPEVVCISTQQKPIELNDEKLDIIMIDGTHRHIKETMKQNILNKLHNENLEYDGLIIILLSIIKTFQDKISPKSFFDKAGEQRAIDKLKTDIIYRLPDENMSVILDYSMCVTLSDKTDTKIRPRMHLEHVDHAARRIVVFQTKPKSYKTHLESKSDELKQLQSEIVQNELQYRHDVNVSNDTAQLEKEILKNEKEWQKHVRTHGRKHIRPR
eukprot:535111_1